MSAHPFTNPAAWTAAGWTMLHLIWLGGLLGAIGAALRVLLRRSRPETRYAAALALLGLFAVAPVALFVRVYEPPAVISPGVGEPAKATATGAALPSQAWLGHKLGRPRTLPEAPPTAAAAPSWRWESLVDRLPWLWLIGSTATLGMLGLGLAGVGRIRRESRELIDGSVCADAHRFARSLGVARRFGVGVCDRIASPVLLGVIRPMILLPSAALSGWTADELEMALLHELAHLRRHDNLVNLIQCVVEAILFFHPAAWWLSGWVRLERELCCDRLVVDRTGRSRAYAALLATLTGVKRGNPALSALAEKPILTRIRKILNMEDRPMRLTMPEGFGLIAAAVVAGGLALGARAGKADEAAAPKPSKEAQKQALRAMAEQVAAVKIDTKRFDARGDTLMGISLSQYKVGDRDRAHATMREAGKALEEATTQAKIPAKLGVVVAQSRIAESWREAGEVEAAREALDVATRALYEAIEDPGTIEQVVKILKESGKPDAGDAASMIRVEMSYAIIEVRIALGDLDEARRVILWTLDGAKDLEAGETRVEIVGAMGGMLVRAGDKDAGRAIIRKAQDDAESLPAEGRAFAKQQLMAVLAHCGDFEAVFALFKDRNAKGRADAMVSLLDIIQESDDAAGFRFVDSGGIKLTIGAPGTKPNAKVSAADLRELAIRLRDQDDAKTKARSLSTVAHLLAKVGEFPSAIEAADAIPPIARRDFPGPRDGFYDAVKPATFALVAAEMAKNGDRAGAAALFDRAEALTRDIEPADQKLIAQIVVARSQARAGDRIATLDTVRRAIDVAKARPEPLRSRGLAMLVEAQADAGDPAGAVPIVDAIRAYPPAEKARALNSLSRRFEADGDAASAGAMARLLADCASVKEPEGFKLGPALQAVVFGRGTFLDPDLEFPALNLQADLARIVENALNGAGDPAEAEGAARARPAAARGQALMQVAARVAARGNYDDALRIASTIEDAHDKLSAYQLIAGGIRGARHIAIRARD